MNNYLKSFHPNRLVFAVNSGPEKPSGGSSSAGKPETLEKLSSAIEQSYREQLLMMQDLDKKVLPVKEQIDHHNRIIQEMRGHFSRYPQLLELFRIEGVSGEDIITLMTSDGTYQEYLQEKPINFLQWLIDKSKQQEK
jgi:hypothetical protein